MESPPPRNVLRPRTGGRVWRNRVSARAEGGRKREREVTQREELRPGTRWCFLPIRPDSSDNRMVSMPRQDAEAAEEEEKREKREKSLNFAQTLGAGGALRPTIISISDDFLRNPFETRWLRSLANGGGMDAAAAVGDGRRIDFSLLHLDWVRGKTAALGQDRRRLRRTLQKLPKVGGEKPPECSYSLPDRIDQLSPPQSLLFEASSPLMRRGRKEGK
ncbi:hypothetical protein ASPBRDRAFT_51199 [Aspergillus brasiliensis CBS 101740]|uniref:Uncharacterized protein n=1 Tax=Aspergillus brasiliensis (strain CBS 101740 / IMI 381727 / IBT 21946) TaxID=767769 RepID=A0A1L9UUN3_ASPBC|nr:hypothetical protein ASPBRDRAFT_51199 [Aspergillus brasiliensis CBS 101740]